jgi:hypothetical protein
MGMTAIGLAGVWRASRPRPEAAFRFPTPGAGKQAPGEIEPGERARLEGILAGGERKREPPLRAR